jgi:hypothetical protein
MSLKSKAKYAIQILIVAVLSFTILKPWYSINLALIIYFVLAILSSVFCMDIIIDIMKSKKEKLIEENNLLLEIKELEITNK